MKKIQLSLLSCFALMSSVVVKADYFVVDQGVRTPMVQVLEQENELVLKRSGENPGEIVTFRIRLAHTCGERFKSGIRRFVNTFKTSIPERDSFMQVYVPLTVGGNELRVNLADLDVFLYNNNQRAISSSDFTIHISSESKRRINEKFRRALGRFKRTHRDNLKQRIRPLLDRDLLTQLGQLEAFRENLLGSVTTDLQDRQTRYEDQALYGVHVQTLTTLVRDVERALRQVENAREYVRELTDRSVSLAGMRTPLTPRILLNKRNTMYELERSTEARHPFFLDEFANTDYCQRLAALRGELRGDDRFPERLFSIPFILNGFQQRLGLLQAEFPATAWEAFGSGVRTAAGEVGRFALGSVGILARTAAYNLDRRS